MLFKKKANKQDRLSRNSTPPKPTRRPDSYRYHAVRDSQDHRNRGDQTAKRFNKQQPASVLERVTAAMFIIVVVVSLLYVFWLSTEPRVRLVNDEANILLQDEATYIDGVQDILDNSLLSQTKLTINSQSLAKQILNRFPELATATVTIPISGHRPIIELQPKQPQLLLTSNGTTFVIDIKGSALIELSALDADKQEQLATLPRVNDTSSITPKTGEQVVTSQTVTFMQQLLHQYKAASISVSRMELPADKPNELHAYGSDEKFYVKYVVIRPANEQFGAFIAVKDKLTGEGVTPSEYIDVRVESKVFYK